jgi:hypothetical protein
MSRRKPLRQRVIISLGRRPILSYSALQAEVREVTEIAGLLNEELNRKVARFPKRPYRTSPMLH